jgi:glycosyltransferase involved in cell wall biosynthesis
MIRKNSKYYYVSLLKNFLNKLQIKNKRVLRAVNLSKTLTFSTKNNLNIFNEKFKTSGIIISDQAITNNELLKPSIKTIRKFIFVGSLNSRKNIQLILEIAKKHHLDLDVIGDGPLFKKLFNNYSSKKINFKGKLTRTEVLNNIKKSDCLLIPSYVEANTSVLYEALACGIAVLTNDRDGFETELPSLFSVSQTEVKNYYDLKHSWLKSINELRNTDVSIINSEIERLQNEKTWKQMASTYKKLYEKIV